MTDVRMPDGTIIQNVPDGVTQSQLQARYAKTQPGLMGTLKDVGQSALSGLEQGANAVAGMYGSVRDFTANAARNSPIASALPITAALFPQASQVIRAAPSTGRLNRDVPGANYTAKTTLGKYAQTIASFAPAAIGGEASIPYRLARVVGPAVASEAAGQATQGTALEPYARGAGAIVGGVATALAPAAGRSIMTAANRAVTAATGQSFLDPEQQAAQGLARAVASGPGGAQGAVSRAAQYRPVGASNPTAVDVGGNQTLRLVRAAAQAGEGDAQDIAQSYADKIRAGLPDQMISRATALTPDRRPAGTVAAELAQQQGQQAATNYAGPYSQQATLTPEAVSALQGPAGQSAIRRALTAAQARRDPQQTAELQGLLKWTENPPEQTTGLGYALEDVKRARSAMPQEKTIVGAIGAGGGIETKNAAGEYHQGGSELADILSGSPGYTMNLVNNTRSTAPGTLKGVPPDIMAQRLVSDRWLPAGSGIDEMNDLISRHVSGEPIYHPESDIHDEISWRESIDRELNDAGVTSSDPSQIAAQKLDAYRRAVHPQSYAALQSSVAAANALPPQISTGALHRIGIAMRERATLADRQSAGDIASGLKSRSSDIRQAISQTPGMEQANAAYRASSANQQAIELGQGGMNMPASDYAAQLSDLAAQSPAAQAHASIGYRQAITESIGRQRAGATGPALTLATAPEQTQKLIATFGPKDAGDFQKALQLEVGRLRNANALPPGSGSQTAGRLEDTAGIGHIWPSKAGLMLYLARALTRGTTTPAERAAIVRMGTDPDKVQAILAQAAKIRRPGLHGPAAATAIGFQQQANP